MASSFLSTLFALTLVVTDAASSLSISESGTLASVNQHRSLMRKDGAQADPDPAGTTAADSDAGATATGAGTTAAVTAGGTVATTDAAAAGTCASPGTLPETPECGKFEGCKATGKNNREELELGDKTPCANVKDANGVNLDLIECSCKRTETVGQVVALKDAAGNDIVQEEFTCCHKDYQHWKDVLPGSTIESVPIDPTCHDTCYKVSGSGIIQSKADKKPIALPGANDPAEEALQGGAGGTTGTSADSHYIETAEAGSWDQYHENGVVAEKNRCGASKKKALEGSAAAGCDGSKEEKEKLKGQTGGKLECQKKLLAADPSLKFFEHDHKRGCCNPCSDADMADVKQDTKKRMGALREGRDMRPLERGMQRRHRTRCRKKN